MSERELIEVQIKALTIYHANDKMLSVKQCAEFLGKCEKTIINRINSKDPHNKIHAVYKGGWMIPKIQFIQEVLASWNALTK